MTNYVVSKTYDDLGKTVYYVHPKGFPYVCVFGSVGDLKKANKIKKLYNQAR